MVYGTYNYSYWGLKTNFHITGRPHVAGFITTSISKMVITGRRIPSAWSACPSGHSGLQDAKQKEVRSIFGFLQKNLEHGLAIYYIYIHTYVHTYIQTDRQTDRHTYRHTDIHTYIHTDIHTYIQTDIHTYIQTDIHTYIQTDIHTYVRTYIYTYTYIYIYTLIYIYIYIHWYIYIYIHWYIYIYIHWDIYIYTWQQMAIESIDGYRGFSLWVLGGLEVFIEAVSSAPFSFPWIAEHASEVVRWSCWRKVW